MKKILFISVVFSLFYSCLSDDMHRGLETEEVNNEENVEDSVFQYSIIIKSKTGEDLLHSGQAGVFGIYGPNNIAITWPTQKNVIEQRHFVKPYENEWRIVVNIDFEEKTWDNQVETILVLWVLLPSWILPPDPFKEGAKPGFVEGISTNDTIRCSIAKDNRKVICNKIWVNEMLMWERNNSDEEPFFELEKAVCQGFSI